LIPNDWFGLVSNTIARILVATPVTAFAGYAPDRS
jgi:hypothetical protein